MLIKTPSVTKLKYLQAVQEFGSLYTVKMSKMRRIAWFSLVGDENAFRTAFYSREMIPRLKDQFEIELFIGDEDYKKLGEGESSHDIFGVKAYHYLRAYLRNLEDPFDCIVYHLEDHPRADFVRNSSLVEPGIIFAHDIEFHDPLAYIHPGKDDLIPVSTLNFPGSVIVCNNGQAVSLVKAPSVDGKVALTPLPIQREESDAILRYRKQGQALLEKAASERVIGFVGREAIEERVLHTLEAVTLLLEKDSQLLPVWLVFSELEKQKAEQLVGSLSLSKALSKKLQIVFPQTREELLSLLAAVDLFCHLRFDTAHALSHWVLQAMAVQTPVIVSNVGAATELPMGVALKVVPGEGESVALAYTIKEALSNSALYESLQKQALSYLELVHDPGLIKADFETLIETYQEYVDTEREKKGEKYLSTENLLVREMLGAFRTEEVATLFRNDAAGHSSENALTHIGEAALKSFSWGSR